MLATMVRSAIGPESEGTDVTLRGTTTEMGKEEHRPDKAGAAKVRSEV